MLRLLLKGEEGREKRLRLKWLHMYVIIRLSGHQKITLNKRPKRRRLRLTIWSRRLKTKIRLIKMQNSR
jgi:hypothetical protein